MKISKRQLGVKVDISTHGANAKTEQLVRLSFTKKREVTKITVR